jgi:nucleotide-binding universal stress UspA family protein
MGGIICAVRGGLDCRNTVTRAIGLAKGTDLPVHFLYVVNHDLLPRVDSGHVRTVAGKMGQMCTAVLQAAQATAEALGIPAEVVVRQGVVEEEIVSLCQDLEADYVVLGCPGTDGKTGVEGEGLIEKLGEQIKGKTGAQVVLSEGSNAEKGGATG